MTTITLVNIGSSPNDGTGDDLRTAFDKANGNFSNIALALSSGNAYTNLNIENTVTSGNLVTGAVTANSVTVTQDVAAGNVSINNLTANGNVTATGLTATSARVTGNLVVGQIAGNNKVSGGYLFVNGVGGSGTAGQTGISPGYQYYAMNANLVLPNGAGDVRIFNSNVFLAAATTYEFDLLFCVQRNITTLSSTQLQLNFGTAAVSNPASLYWINYHWSTGNASPGAFGGTVFGSAGSGNIAFGWANVATNVAITAASTAGAATVWATARGTFTTNTAGWIAPTVAYSTSPGGISYVQGGSRMKIAAVGIGAAGSGTAGGNVAIGTWA